MVGEKTSEEVLLSIRTRFEVEDEARGRFGKGVEVGGSPVDDTSEKR